MTDFFRLHTFLAKGPDRRETMAHLALSHRYIVLHAKTLRNREKRRCDKSLARKITRQFSQE